MKKKTLLFFQHMDQAPTTTQQVNRPTAYYVITINDLQGNDLATRYLIIL